MSRGDPAALVVLVKARERRLDLVVREGASPVRRVSSAATHDGFAQDAQRPQRDVLEVADRRRDDEQGARRGGE